jgi:hypothetical protein
MQNSLRFLIACMLLSSFITHTIDINSENLILSRMTISDAFGLLAIALFFVKRGFEKSWKNKIPPVYLGAIIVVTCSALSFFTSLSPKSTVFEVLILSYLVLLSYVVCEVLKSEIHFFIIILVSASFLAFTIGLYDLLAVNRNWFTIFPNVNSYHVGSSFRYFGQAANYSFTMLTILIPLKYARLTDKYSLLKKRYINMTLVLGIFFLLATGRISIILSFIIALGVFLVYTRKARIIKDISSIVLLLGVFVTFAIYAMPKVVSNVINRFEQRITHRESGSLATDFIVDNFINTFISFFDNPWFGSGLGGFVNNYGPYEIHGTYLKMIGETGLIGFVGYLVFIVLFVKMCLNVKTSYFYYFLPFLLGSLISWSYNYHLRKKEFWILFSFLVLLEFYYKKNTDLNTKDN